MTWGMGNKGAQHTVGIAEIRLLVLDRIEQAQRRLDPASVSAAFARANDNSQDNMLGSLLLGMIGWTPLMDAFGGGLDGAFSAAANSPMLAAAADGLSMVWDEKAMKNRRRRNWRFSFKDGVYHGGRSQAGIMTATEMKRSFNVVSANENAGYAYDVQAEIAGMNDMLDMLDSLAKDGVTQLKMDTRTAISTQVQQAALAPVKGLSQHRQTVAMRKAI